MLLGSLHGQNARHDQHVDYNTIKSHPCRIISYRDHNVKNSSFWSCLASTVLLSRAKTVQPECSLSLVYHQSCFNEEATLFTLTYATLLANKCHKDHIKDPYQLVLLHSLPVLYLNNNACNTVPCVRQRWTHCSKVICPKGSTNLPNNRSNPIADILAMNARYKLVITLTTVMLASVRS